MEEKDIEEALLLAERIGEDVQAIADREEIDPQILIVALVWAAIGLGTTHTNASRSSLKLGLHFAVESALEDPDKNTTYH